MLKRKHFMLQVMQQGKPYGNCKKDPDYKDENCLVDWDYDLFLKQCNCRTLDMKRPGRLNG